MKTVARDDDKMAAWVRQYGHHPSVKNWLKKNPPPPNWQGTPEEWAYTEMAAAPGWLLHRWRSPRG